MVMKSPCVGSLVPNEVVTAQFLVIWKEIRHKKTGEPYLCLHLADRTGEIEAKMWDNVAEVMHTFEKDHFVKVKGAMQLYQNRVQFTVHRLRRLEDHEVDLADYFPCSERDPEEMFAELKSVISQVENAHLRALLNAIFSDGQICAKYKIAPAAKNIHHACRGGLLEHVLSLVKLCRFAASHYKNVDKDLLITGAILHDIGKIEELSYSRSFGYSPEGQLLGHIVIGLRIVTAKIDALPDFPSKLRTLVEHMIISHHGEMEFGSPKVPAFQEALLLHYLDNLDSKMEAMRSALQRDRHVDGDFTGWVASLDRVLLRRERFWADEAVSRENTEALKAAEPPQAETQEVLFPDAMDSKPDAPAPTPEAQPHKEEQRPIARDNKSAPMTFFGEKLQAVLDSRK